MKTTPSRVLAFIGFGANLGDPFATMTRVLKAFVALPETLLAACSSYYRSAPRGVTSPHPDYINAVIALNTGLTPQALFDALLSIEFACGRRRIALLAPRPLDLDLLLYGETVMQSSTLTLPHPRMHLRAFVLLPLAEIAPDLSLPGHGSLSSLLAKVKDQRIVRIRDIRPVMPAGWDKGAVALA
ncbi:MAG: 2-amino-4-hydroxy-6-hydroxymethyldihydropteridine diphosphokinase [Azoarcus sp.]|jgi:2-amino-4-hydroxy-6-hydroxymethyldihydropteridine diphosphokinase|nr:2-amino-4-hydroxy-6-hydroxymethyldihydropteridine diphosphokinase [Azoarcus sp.]